MHSTSSRRGARRTRLPSNGTTPAGRPAARPVSDRRPIPYSASVSPQRGSVARRILCWTTQPGRDAQSCPRRWPSRCSPRAGEEVGAQLSDVDGLVVVHPMGRLRQSLDALQIWHVVVFRLGELLPQILVAFPPN